MSFPASKSRAAAALAVLFCLVFAIVAPAPASAEPRDISAAEDARLSALIAQRNTLGGLDAGELRARIAGLFLGAPYRSDTLVGSSTRPERLVAPLLGVDCFTMLDYVEALARSSSKKQFFDQLTRVRYQDGRVAFAQRRHFFTDWAATAPLNAVDVTASVSSDTVPVAKQLNRKDDGGTYLTGLPVRPRTVTYIPSVHVTDQVIASLRDGDYLGAYAEDGGLDVTHVGVFVRSPAGPVLRNASSLRRNMKVVDSPLREYLVTVPGIVVFRATA